MDLLDSLYNGVSGVNAMGQKMNVTANNLANINTSGYKCSQTQFADILESSMGPAFTGNGVQVGSISTSFASGSQEATSRSTDMAISGSGLFVLRDSDKGTADLYTRDGEFNLVDHRGAEPNALNLVTPTGQFVQGYNVSTGTGPSAVAGDILVKKVTPQVATSQVDVMLNLDSQKALLEKTDTPLFDSWDGRTTTDPIASQDYDYKTSIKIYGPGNETDPLATTSDYLTIYFDSTTNPNEKEFLVTCDPTLDQRLISGDTSRYSTADKGAGALLYGVLHFSTSGDLSSIDCWSVPPSGEVAPSEANKIALGRGEPFYSFDYNFSGTAANSTSKLNFGNTPKPQAVVSPGIAFSDKGVSSPLTATSTWDSIYDSLGAKVQAGDTIRFQGASGDGTPRDFTYTVDLAKSMQDLLADLENQFACKAEVVNGQLTLTDTVIGASQLAIDAITYANASGVSPLDDPSIAQPFGSQGASFTIDQEERYIAGSLATTSYASPSATLFQGQDGFGKGWLQDIHVDGQGYIVGQYSNGQQVKQAQLVLADFTSLQGLRAAGGNTFEASAESGPPIFGTSGQGSFGTVDNNSLEMSNVDVSREMVDVIVTQRAFQANAKCISTADEIYEKLLQLIR